MKNGSEDFRQQSRINCFSWPKRYHNSVRNLQLMLSQLAAYGVKLAAYGVTHSNFVAT